MMQISPQIVEAVKIARRKGYGWEEIAKTLDLAWTDLHSIVRQIEPAEAVRQNSRRRKFLS
jgi:hypothetical protein